jgi:hypothetical protein
MLNSIGVHFLHLFKQVALLLRTGQWADGKHAWVRCCRPGVPAPVPHMASNEDRTCLKKKVALLLTVSTETILPA